MAASDPSPFLGFGYAVALAGDTALIGANMVGAGTGLAYMFQFDGTGWVQTQRFEASDGEPGDCFGCSGAVGAGTALIGAYSHQGSFGIGTVYVYHHDGSKWLEDGQFQPLDDADAFGIAVSMDGSRALIGASWDDDNGTQSGSAYIFRFDDESSQWVEEQKLVASDGSSGAFFGGAVALCGDVAVIGADGDYYETGIGSAYVFHFDPNARVWVEAQKLLPFEGSGFTHFGHSVSVDGDVILVGAYASGGSAYVYRFDAALKTWLVEQRLTASGGNAGQFGRAVAIQGDAALVGAWSNESAAYLFRFDGSRWTEQQVLWPEPGPWTPFFGWSVALDGDWAVVGADGENQGAGGAYMYAGLSESDCNANGIGDACDILEGTSADLNADEVPDECECPWDLDGSGSVAVNDFLDLLAAWGTNPGGPPDFDGDGDVAVQDFLALLANWGPCV